MKKIEIEVSEELLDYIMVKLLMRRKLLYDYVFNYPPDGSEEKEVIDRYKSSKGDDRGTNW